MSCSCISVGDEYDKGERKVKTNKTKVLDRVVPGIILHEGEESRDFQISDFQKNVANFTQLSSAQVEVFLKPMSLSVCKRIMVTASVQE